MSDKIKDQPDSKKSMVQPDHPGGYFVMIDSEKSCDHKPTLVEARLSGQTLCDAEFLPASFSIQDGDGEHVEDILRSDGMDLSEQVENFLSKQVKNFNFQNKKTKRGPR